MVLSVVFAFLLSSLALWADTKTWIGASGGAWGTAANWDSLGVFLITDDVCISGFSSIIIPSPP